MSKKNKYGFSSSDYEKLYFVWKHIKDRCYKSRDKEYHAYGGREIKMCDEWLKDFHSFSDWAVAYGWKPGVTIERINNNGNYSPENCRFATPREQMYNKQNTIFLDINGKTKSLPEWCDILGIKRGMVVNRINRGETDPTRLFFKGNLKDYGRRIVQKSKDGKEIQTFRSSGEAERATGVYYSSIINCCNGDAKTAGGYVWEYKTVKEII